MSGKRLFKAGFSIFTLSLAAFVILWKVSSLREFQLFGTLVTQVKQTDHRKTVPKRIALSFDDGPTPEYTPQVLEILAKAQVKATFFVTGAETEKHLAEAKALVSAGHELGNHSYSHSRMIFKSPVFVAHEIERTDRAIRMAGWTGPILFRPPYGKRLFVLPWYLAQHDRTTVMWSIEPETYPALTDTPETFAQHVVDRAQPGAIVLMHVMYASREVSRQALPLIIDRLKARGYQWVTVAELLQTQNLSP